METELKCCYKFHPVGQGCFFSAKYYDENEEIKATLVYDCGTASTQRYLESSIKKFKDELATEGRSEIDVMMISHYDIDHVSGVFELLKEVKCRNLIIPYVSVFERIFLFAKGREKAEWYIEFLKNPITFVRENEQLDVDRIILMNGGSEEFQGVDDFQVISLDEVEIDLKGMSTIISDRLDEMTDIKQNTSYLTIASPTVLSILNGSVNLKFYNRYIDPNKIKKFTDEFRSEFQFTKINELFEKGNVLKIRALAKKYYRDLNASSLCVNISLLNQVFFYDDDSLDLLHGHQHRYNGIMLTGDSELITNKKCEPFINCYRNDLQQLLLYQLPHHGSKNSILLDSNSDLWGFPLYVINHGEMRVYHPHTKVKEFIVDNNVNVHYNHEAKPISFGYSIKVNKDSIT